MITTSAVIPPPSPTAAEPMGDERDGHALTAEHALLRAGTAERAGRVRAAIVSGRRPGAEVEALVDFLRYEVIGQAVREERTVFRRPRRGYDDPRIRRLVAEHVALRDATDALVDATRHADPAGGSTTAALDELLHRLDVHLQNEEDALAPLDARRPATDRPDGRPRSTFSLTEGRTLDLDRLPAGHADAALLDRLMRMRPTDQVRVRSSAPLEPLWRLLQRRLPGDYGWVYLREGPLTWEAELTRRTLG